MKKIFLVALFRASDLNDANITYDSFFSPIISELKFLENTGIIVNGQTIYGTLTSLSHDNLGANQMLGFVSSFRSTNFCRICLMTKSDTEVSTIENVELLRTIENYNETINEIETTDDANLNNIKGIKTKCVFNELNHFNIIDNCSVDPMHDILEGVGPFF